MKTIVIDSSRGGIQQIYGDAGIRVVLVDRDEAEDAAEQTGFVFPVVPLSEIGGEVAARVATALQAEGTSLTER